MQTISLLQIVEAKELFDQMKHEQQADLIAEQSELNLENNNEIAHLRNKIILLLRENRNQRETIRNLTLVIAIVKNSQKITPKKHFLKSKIAISGLSIPKQQLNDKNTDKDQIVNNEIINNDVFSNHVITKNLLKSPKLIDDYDDDNDYNLETNQCIYF
jgi:hypothetical protein